MSDVRSIDIHAHFYPEGYLRLVEADGAPFGVSCSYAAPGGPVIDVGASIPSSSSSVGARSSVNTGRPMRRPCGIPVPESTQTIRS